MNFCEKLKKLRNENGLTQEELANKIYVTRTAISKWETGNGYPSLDSLKEISNLFGVSIDELISDADVESKKIYDEKAARKYYYIAMAFLSAVVISTVISYFLKLPYLNILSIFCLFGYVFFGLLSKPKYKRFKARKIIIPYIISRLVIFIIVVGLAIYTMLTL